MSLLVSKASKQESNPWEGDDTKEPQSPPCVGLRAELFGLVFEAGSDIKTITLFMRDFPSGPVAKTQLLPVLETWIPLLVRVLEPTCRN